MVLLKLKQLMAKLKTGKNGCKKIRVPPIYVGRMPMSRLGSSLMLIL